MTSLKDQIQAKIRKEREQPERPRESKPGIADEARKRLDGIRQRLDELSHATDKYSLKVSYAKGAYAADVAVIDLENVDGTWVAAWQVATTAGGSLPDWEVTYNPHGVETVHEWFRNADDLFKYLTASIAERVVEMDAKQR